MNQEGHHIRKIKPCLEVCCYQFVINQYVMAVILNKRSEIDMLRVYGNFTNFLIELGPFFITKTPCNNKDYAIYSKYGLFHIDTWNSTYAIGVDNEQYYSNE